MIQNRVQQKCLEHSEDIVAIDESEKDLQKRTICATCLTNLLAKGQKKQVKNIKDSINQINEFKQLLKENRLNYLETILENINQFNDSVEQLKNFYIQQIEQIMSTIKKWGESIQNLEEAFINKVQQQESIDYQLFVEFVKQEENASIQKQVDFKVKIKNLLLSLTETDLIKKNQLLLDNQSTQPVLFENKEYGENKNIEKELNIICEDHNQKIILFDLSKERTSYKRIGCLGCLDGTKNQYTSIQIAHEIWQTVQQQRLQKMTENHDQIQNKVNNLKSYLKKMQKGLDSAIENATNKINVVFEDYSTKVNNSTNNFKNTSWQNFSKEEIIEIAQDLSQISTQNGLQDPLLNEYTKQDNLINQSVSDALQFFQECYGSQLNKIKGLIDNLQIVNSIQIELKESTKELECQNTILTIDQQQKQQKIQEFKQTNQSQQNQQYLNSNSYSIVLNSSIKQNEYCYALAINQDNSILVAGCDMKIKVFEFQQEQLKQIQLLSEHLNLVLTLNFMQKSNQFISGSSDNLIIIWFRNEDNYWICKQKLNGHSSYIYCLILNNDENLIISGSKDSEIKFWIKQNEWKCCQTITDHENTVCGLSLNDQQNKVISCGSDKVILIIEQPALNEKWNVIQRITVDDFGYRICFINDNLFTFQPYLKEFMHIYELNTISQQFSKTRDLAVRCNFQGCNYLYPNQYIKSKCLLTNKNGQNLNLIRIQKNQDFIIEQAIEFETNCFYGYMSNDGKYLITWDNKQCEFQIRKYQEK
ncbi:unnamed protein product [Paramecium sonneborni]|uniref:WD40-repeat-containing domain n=1 Tax=Paramecium sonneborni TaxID=65129 RepID=A0A8S1QW91_9CILI|nr:unnamed protein product [Paramecium sonneborni]